MADKKRELVYIEFRYKDGTSQKLIGKEAQNWMGFNKRKLALVSTVDKEKHKPNWEWARFDSKGKPLSDKAQKIMEEDNKRKAKELEEAVNRFIKENARPPVDTKPLVEPKPILKPEPKPKPKSKPNYSEYENY